MNSSSNWFESKFFYYFRMARSHCDLTILGSLLSAGVFLFLKMSKYEKMELFRKHIVYICIVQWLDANGVDYATIAASTP